MKRKNFLVLALSLPMALFSRKVEATPPAPLASAKKLGERDWVMPTVTKTRAELLEIYGKPHAVGVDFGAGDRVSVVAMERPAPSFGVVAAPNLSGVDLPFVSVWCQCPACHGSGFRGEDRDQCGYCRMNGRLVTSETFAMYNGAGDAEVWRALVWHEWSQRNWTEAKDGPQPLLPGMLCYIGQQHPEVYDTAVRDCIFEWLEKRFDKVHAQAQYDAWVSEVERQNREDVRLKHLYARDDAA